MTKYVEVTKVMVGTPDEDNIDVGKTYELVDTDLTGVYIYASRANPKYFLFNEQFKYVEQNEEEKQMTKEYPVATFKVDVKEVIQAKIEQLRTDAEIIANKRKRMQWQVFMLDSKADKLEEVLETIKEFE